MDCLNNNDIRRLLAKVERPARYSGGELNCVIKKDADVLFALSFPDVYEIGMSHLGSRILYHTLNSRADTACERVYAPWPDMENELRENEIPLFSLENKRPLAQFDIIGFSLLYEMCYTNILNMLELSGIPPLSADRGEEHPLIVCGGPCACNPEPIAPFMDAVMIGDGEEMIGELVETYAKCRKRGADRRALLTELSRIEGVYIPSFYEPAYDQNGLFTGMKKTEPSAPDRVRRRIVRDLDVAAYIGKPIVPFLSIVHDRIALEIFRGCTRGCRFCQAGFIYRPVREREKETVLTQARDLIACTGYDEISLFSLSSGDYSRIHELVPEILEEFETKQVSISLPSLRIDSFLKDDLEKMQSVRKAGLTFAPEAGTQRLRDVINKCVTEQDLMRAVGDAFESGWTSVKLYFMIGLPTETEEDLQGIADLARKVSEMFYAMPKSKRGKGLRLTVSASSFVPKPFTPFQWEPQNSKEELIEKQRYVKNALKGIKGVEFSYHAPDISVLEAVFAKGDRRLADVLMIAHQKGARFDSWDEHFKPVAWSEAFEQAGVSPSYYAHRRTKPGVVTPWSHLDMIVTEDYLAREYDRALKMETTKDCRGGCNGCFGACYADYCKV